MWSRVTAWLERRITLVSQLLVLGVFALWALSAFLAPLSDFLTRGSFYNVVTLVLLFEIVRRVVEIKLESAGGGLRAYVNQDATWTDTQVDIQALRPRTVDMLEYSGNTALSILDEVFQVQPKAKVRLLLHHPVTNVLNEFESDRINQNIRTLRRHMAPYALEVRLYTPAAGMRGRNFADQVVTVGWYTYHYGDDETEIRGHSNAMVVGRSGSPEGQALLETFDRTFTNLWEHPETVEWTALPSTP